MIRTHARRRRPRQSAAVVVLLFELALRAHLVAAGCRQEVGSKASRQGLTSLVDSHRLRGYRPALQTACGLRSSKASVTAIGPHDVAVSDRRDKAHGSASRRPQNTRSTRSRNRMTPLLWFVALAYMVHTLSATWVRKGEVRPVASRVGGPSLPGNGSRWPRRCARHGGHRWPRCHRATRSSDTLRSVGTTRSVYSAAASSGWTMRCALEWAQFSSSSSPTPNMSATSWWTPRTCTSRARSGTSCGR